MKSLADLQAKARFKITDPLQEAPVVLELLQNGEPIKIGTLGNILLVQAKGKAGKTFYTSALTACLIAETSYINHVGKLPPEKPKVIYFDTEQGHEDARTVQERIYKMAGYPINEEVDNFEYYCLRPFVAAERLNLIDYILNNTPGVGVVVIDGIRDLINDFNDTGQSFILIEKLMKWSDERKIHIISILHQNPNDDKARGHLGTELTNKAEYIISIGRDKQDDSFRTIEGYGRRKSFKPFSYTLDENEFPVTIESKEAGKPEPLKLDTIMHKNLINLVFEKLDKTKKITKNSLWPKIKLNFKLIDHKYNFSDAQCKELVEYYIQQGWINNKGTSEKYDLSL